jgi:glycosyltransferase involved in cell wall biosynthesis
MIQSIKDKNILLAGYDFEQKYHRGITSFSKVLLKVLNDQGAHCKVTLSAPFNTESYLQELFILSKVNNPLEFKISQKRRLYYLLSNIVDFRKRDKIIRFNYSDLRHERVSYLRYAQAIYNYPHLYDILNTHTKLFNGSLSLNTKDSDFLFTTSPISLRPSRSSTALVQVLHDVIPLVTFFHPGGKWEAISFSNRVKNMIKYSDTILSVSEFSKQEVLRLFPSAEAEKKIKVIHQPIPVYDEVLLEVENAEVQRSVLNTFKLNSSEYLFFIGFLETRKNIEKMINAFLALHHKLKIPLVLAGEIDPENETIKKLIKSNNVMFLGTVTNVEKFVLMKHARAFLFPSFYEGFGIPPLEAMKMGCPVLTSNQSSIPEVCGDAALYVDPFSTGSLIEGMYEICTNETLRSNLIKKGYERIKLFTQEIFAEKINKGLFS